MPKQKYSRDDNGYFQTKVWDGTYLEGGKKRYVTVRSTKSSADLEKKIEASFASNVAKQVEKTVK